MELVYIILILLGLIFCFIGIPTISICLNKNDEEILLG